MRDVICFCVDRCFIKVRIVDDEEYEKNEVFYIELDEPELYKAGQYVTRGQYVTWSLRHVTNASPGQYVTCASCGQYVTWYVRHLVMHVRF